MELRTWILEEKLLYFSNLIGQLSQDPYETSKEESAAPEFSHREEPKDKKPYFTGIQRRKIDVFLKV